jgi:hypothetical protein
VSEGRPQTTHTSGRRVTPGLLFNRAFFDLQAFWVERVNELAHIDRLTAWHDWTSMAALVNTDGWDAIDDAVRNGDPAEAAHRSWLALRATLGPSQHGCFWYDVEADRSQIRLHFANREGPGALGPGRHATRRAELASALKDARKVAPQAQRLRGGSWLYHLPGYQALFPSTFLAQAIAADSRNEVGQLALWGQFVSGDCERCQQRTNQFIHACTEATDVDDLVAAFPLTKLHVIGSLGEVLAWLNRPCPNSSVAYESQLVAVRVCDREFPGSVRRIEQWLHNHGSVADLVPERVRVVNGEIEPPASIIGLHHRERRAGLCLEMCIVRRIRRPVRLHLEAQNRCVPLDRGIQVLHVRTNMLEPRPTHVPSLPQVGQASQEA